MASVTKNIRAALEKHLYAIAGLPATGGIPNIAWENSEYDPNPVDNYLRARLAPTAERAASVGADAFTRYEGLLLIDCFTRENGGPAIADELADLVKAAFKWGTSLTEDGLKVTISYAERNQGINDAPRYFVPVTIGFYAYYQ